MRERDTRGRQWYIIDPRFSKTLQRWDLSTMLALLFTAAVTPVEVSFLPPPRSASEPLFLINRLVDVIFIVDLCLQFITMFPTNSQFEGAKWVYNPKQISWHCMPALLLPPTSC